MRPILSTWVLVTIIVAFPNAARSEEVIITNKCSSKLYVKNEGADSRAFSLSPKESRTILVQRDVHPKPKIWAHDGCDHYGNNCPTTEGHVSLAEFQIDGSGWMWYNVNQADGYNLPLSLEPIHRTGGNCRSASCVFNVETTCPEINKLFKNDKIVACKNLDRNVETEYSKAIKTACHGVSSYANDTENVMRDCLPGNKGLKVTFC